MSLFETLNSIAGAPIVSIILSLLLTFQWYKQYAKEQSVINNLIAMRRKANLSSYNSQSLFIEDIDATLATLGARHPFKKYAIDLMTEIESQISDETQKELNSGIVVRHSPTESARTSVMSKF